MSQPFLFIYEVVNSVCFTNVTFFFTRIYVVKLYNWESLIVVFLMERGVESLLLCNAWLLFLLVFWYHFIMLRMNPIFSCLSCPHCQKSMYLFYLFEMNLANFSSAFNMVPVYYVFLTSVPYLFSLSHNRTSKIFR